MKREGCGETTEEMHDALKIQSVKIIQTRDSVTERSSRKTNQSSVRLRQHKKQKKKTKKKKE
ncbi:hypothetical protein, partial [Methylobacterium radiotolerans]|uniref:hypothetical protein n=1 Tax=Methylobacterium radiotolerans TaxID=31998 RepID=UPI001AECFC5A